MELKVNDIITMERDHQHNDEITTDRYKVRINSVESVETREGKQGQYCSYTPYGYKGAQPFGFGCGWFGLTGPWHIRVIEHHGNEAPRPERHWYPRPGNPGYDLMC